MSAGVRVALEPQPPEQRRAVAGADEADACSRSSSSKFAAIAGPGPHSETKLS